MRTIKKGAADQSVYFDVLDSTSTTGGRKTGLAYNTASLTAYYVRNGGSATSITLATLAAANSAHSDGGFKEVDATNMPGVYRLDLPDAAVASGAESVVVTIKGATGMVQVSTEIQLVDNVAKDVFDRLGAPAGASIAADIATADTVVDAIKAMTDNLPSDPADASDISGAFSTVNATLSTIAGYIDGEVAAIKTVTDRLDDTLEDDGGTYRFTANALEQAPTGGTAPTASEIADEVQGRTIAAVTTVNGLAANTVTAAALAADAVTEIQSGLATASALATVAGYVDTEVAAIKAKTDNLPSDPADASVVAGLIAGVDAKVDTIDAVVDAIKVKTDELTFTVSGQVDSNTESVNGTTVNGSGTAEDPWGP